MTDQHSITPPPQMSCITMSSQDQPIIRIDAKGFYYRDQFIADAGEAHRLLVDYLRQHQPTTEWKHAND
jgi:hypothetical protein